MAPQQNPRLDWHEYTRPERHAPWKILLPFETEATVLALGLDGPGLASLARSGYRVDAYRCGDQDLDWARRQGESLGARYEFNALQSLESDAKYLAVVVASEFATEFSSASLHSLVVPGGTVVWIGAARSMPRDEDLAALGGHNIRRYGMLPPGDQKVLLPLTNANGLRSALELYLPASAAKRAAVQSAYLPGVPRLARSLLSRQVLVARTPGRLRQSAYLLEHCSDQLHERVDDCAVYVGWTKLVVQLQDARGNVQAIAKISDLPLGRFGIHREVETLRDDELRKAVGDSIPKILWTGEWGGHTVAVQSAVRRGRKKFVTSLTAPHESFLARLAETSVVSGPIDVWPRFRPIVDWISRRDAQTGQQPERLRTAMARCLDEIGDKPVRFHRTHGDFTPWNAILSGGALTVVDWEESEAIGLPLFDAFHFEIASRLHRDPSRLVEGVLDGSFASKHLRFEPATPAPVARLSCLTACWSLLYPRLRYNDWTPSDRSAAEQASVIPGRSGSESPIALCHRG